MAAAATQQADYITLKNHLFHCLRLGEIHGTNVSMAYDAGRRREWARLVDLGFDDWSMADDAIKTDDDTLDEALAECGVTKRDGKPRPVVETDSTAKANAARAKAKAKPSKAQPGQVSKFCNFCKRSGHDEAHCWDKNPNLKKGGNGDAKPGKRRKGDHEMFVSQQERCDNVSATNRPANMDDQDPPPGFGSDNKDDEEDVEDPHDRVCGLCASDEQLSHGLCVHCNATIAGVTLVSSESENDDDEVIPVLADSSDEEEEMHGQATPPRSQPCRRRRPPTPPAPSNSMSSDACRQFYNHLHQVIAAPMADDESSEGEVSQDDESDDESTSERKRPNCCTRPECIRPGAKNIDEFTRMLEFSLDAPNNPVTEHKDAAVAQEVTDALEWQDGKTVDEIIADRERALDDLEKLIAANREADAQWLSECDEQIRKICRNVKGFTLQQLVEKTQFCDPLVTQLLKQGAPMVGELTATGLGRPLDPKTGKPLDGMRVAEQGLKVPVVAPGAREPSKPAAKKAKGKRSAATSPLKTAMPPRGLEQCRREQTPDAATLVTELQNTFLRRNRELIATLREDPQSAMLLEEMWNDAQKGRMSDPIPLESFDLRSGLLARRFSIEQGVKEDGTPKYRCVDDESANGTNGACRATEKLVNEHIDQLLIIIAKIWATTGKAPGLWKADVDAAYRRVPVMNHHRKFLWVVIKHEGQVWVARHNATCFGATASVHAWNRVGALLAHLARVTLHLPVIRYVDDYFAADRAELAAHALQCFARMSRMLFGEDSIQDRKMEHGNPLTVLGVKVSTSDTAVEVWVADEKVEKWTAQIDNILQRNNLFAAEAAIVAGRLSFAAESCFLRLGRAPIRPIFAQAHSPLPGGRMSKPLGSALRWWRHYLNHPKKRFQEHGASPDCVHVFTDARSTPPRLGAVMIVDGRIYYSDAAPDKSTMDLLIERRDNQIMALEMLAAYFGVTTFQSQLRGKCVHVWIDNTSGEGALTKGAARGVDHNSICHQLWVYAADAGIGLHLHRVPSALNISDPPSREEYEALHAYGAVPVPPVQPLLQDIHEFAHVPGDSARPQSQSKRTGRRRLLRGRAIQSFRFIVPYCKQLLGVRLAKVCDEEATARLPVTLRAVVRSIDLPLCTTPLFTLPRVTSDDRAGLMYVATRNRIQVSYPKM